MARCNVSNLTPAQLDGIACVVCAGEDGVMIPVDIVDGCQVFAHRACLTDVKPARPVLVVGNVTTPDNYADVRAFAADVADRLRFPAVIAVGREYDLTLYEGVVLADDWATSYESAALGCEALLSDMCTLFGHEIYEHPINIRCGHCGDDDPQAAPVWLDERWTTSVCPDCVSVHANGGLVETAA